MNVDVGIRGEKGNGTSTTVALYLKFVQIEPETTPEK